MSNIEDDDYMISMATLVIRNAEQERLINELKEGVKSIKDSLMNAIEWELKELEDYDYNDMQYKSGKRDGIKRVRMIICNMEI